MNRPTVLIIAGSDSSGGAGIARDVQVLTQLEVEVRCVITAVTAQTNARVTAIHCVSPQLVREQMRAALETGDVSAIKIGMLGLGDTVAAVASLLPSRARVPVVLDPVLASSSRAPLLEASGLDALRKVLLPRVTLLTPNLDEAAQLLMEEIAGTDEAVLDQARKLLRTGSQAVLIKGGHRGGADAADILLTADSEPITLRAPRISAELRGTGCALSSAIAASLARRVPLAVACQQGKMFVWNRIRCTGEVDVEAVTRVSDGRRRT